LTGKIKPDHVFAPGDHRPETSFFNQENIRRTDNFLERLKPLASSKNALLSQLVIRWTIEQPGITIALVGARDKEQATENAKAADIMLSRSEITLIDNELKQLKLVDYEIPS
jgi:aryl-alcohol dehydrogenase-like predicted oxidoreductase